jgi:hypothetical protein
MTTIASKIGARGVFAATLLLAVACGGRVVDDAENTRDPAGSGQPTDTPVPTCGEICRRAVDHCFPGGAITQCAKDCEDMRSDYMGCKGLDTFLRCRVTSPVLCTDKVILDGCYTELNELVRCKS